MRQRIPEDTGTKQEQKDLNCGGEQVTGARPQAGKGRARRSAAASRPDDQIE